MMTYNSDTLTVYNRDNNTKKYYRKVIYNNLIDNSSRINTLKTGNKDADTAYISIRDLGNYKNFVDWSKLSNTDKGNYYTLQKNGDDFIVKGECNIEIDTTSTTTIAASLKEIKDNFITFKIATFDEKLRGSSRIRHIEVGGK